MPEPRSAPQETAGAERFLTFRADGQLYALPAGQVAEVIRTPAVARVPQGPKGLLGLANLRGVVLPVASLRGLLGKAEAGASEQARVIVLQGAAPAALAVDTVEALVQPRRLEAGGGEFAANAEERLSGAFRTGSADEVAKVLDAQAMLEAAFTARARPRRAGAAALGADLDIRDAHADQRQRLVAFEVAGQAFALPLDQVREIVPAPAAIAATPHADSALLGVCAWRETLLPVLSLRALLGLPVQALDGRAKLLVAPVRDGLVGLLVDRMQEIVAAEPRLIEPAPPMLAARAGGESRIAAIYRGDGGQRLISILAPDQLFREDVMQRLGGAAAPAEPAAHSAAADQVQHLVFRLGDDEFGLPIEAVVEVARVPEQITRVPKTPKFLEGVINLRGEVLPVIDQRRRFDMPAYTGEGRRLIVVRTESHRAGLIVDSVSDVLRSSRQALDEAPDLPGEANRLVDGVLNLEEQQRIVLVLDPAELLTRAERGLLDAFSAEAAESAL